MTTSAVGHTPGPWITEDFAGVWAGNLELAKIRGEQGLPREANARLIAAAPEMLEALTILANIDPSEITAEDIRKARAAIAKATGKIGS
jgi:hypothetical protein